mmetsp:Transcript_1700/g.6227  ORF Transcript_1700/g.6227 Transcript_1700/m.6227 type:complete len:439 (+) Transcript_1700:262-1578(+)
MQGRRIVPAPPLEGLSRQYLHVPHSSALQPGHAPHRWARPLPGSSGALPASSTGGVRANGASSVASPSTSGETASPQSLDDDTHLRKTHGLRIVPAPPRDSLSLQYLHSPHSEALQLAQFPHRRALELTSAAGAAAASAPAASASSAASSREGKTHLRRTHGRRIVPWPPRAGLSKQYLHAPHSLVQHPAQLPQRFARPPLDLGGGAFEAPTSSATASSPPAAAPSAAAARACSTAATTRSSFRHGPFKRSQWPLRRSFFRSSLNPPNFKNAEHVAAVLYFSYRRWLFPVLGLICKRVTASSALMNASTTAMGKCISASNFFLDAFRKRGECSSSSSSATGRGFRRRSCRRLRRRAALEKESSSSRRASSRAFIRASSAMSAAMLSSSNSSSEASFNSSEYATWPKAWAALERISAVSQAASMEIRSRARRTLGSSEP